MITILFEQKYTVTAIEITSKNSVLYDGKVGHNSPAEGRLHLRAGDERCTNVRVDHDR